MTTSYLRTGLEPTSEASCSLHYIHHWQWTVSDIIFI